MSGQPNWQSGWARIRRSEFNTTMQQKAFLKHFFLQRYVLHLILFLNKKAFQGGLVCELRSCWKGLSERVCLNILPTYIVFIDNCKEYYIHKTFVIEALFYDVLIGNQSTYRYYCKLSVQAKAIGHMYILDKCHYIREGLVCLA